MVVKNAKGRLVIQDECIFTKEMDRTLLRLNSATQFCMIYKHIKPQVASERLAFMKKRSELFTNTNQVFSDDEARLIAELYPKYKNRYRAYVKYFKGRSARQIEHKIRYMINTGKIKQLT